MTTKTAKWVPDLDQIVKLRLSLLRSEKFPFLGHGKRLNWRPSEGYLGNVGLKVYRKLRCTTSTFITGYNPYSQVSSEAENVEAQSQLEFKLRKFSIKTIDGFGEDGDGPWPGEPSVLALGVPLDAAKSLGVEFHQNAIVWVPEDATPQLILLR